MSAENDSPSADLGPMPPRQAAGAHVHLLEGRVLADRYDVLRRIAVRGAGAVFAAFDREREKDVAIMVPLPDLIQDKRFKERFLREMELASRLSHPGIVKVHEVQWEGELPLVTMELLAGRTLRQKMRAMVSAGESFSVDEVVRLGNALCQALSFAHHHMVHRGVRPEHVFLCDDGTVKLTDFGTDALMDASQRTVFGLSAGATSFMAPEQLRGSKEIDHRADQFATAAILYEMLTGEAPAGRVRPARQRRPDTTRSLSRALDRALESDPADRFADMGAFAAALTGRTLSATGGTKSWVIAVVVLVVITGAATFPTWRRPAGSMIQRVLRDPKAEAAAKTARMQALAAATSWQTIAKVLPDDHVPSGIARALEIMSEGEGHLEAMAFSDAEESFRQALELYELQIAEATGAFRDEPSEIARATRDLYEKLGSLERGLHGRVSESARRVDGCERSLRNARMDDERSAVEKRLVAATDELNLLNRLRSLTLAHVFSAPLRAEINDRLSQADQQIEGARYREALESYGETKSRIEELLDWPGYAESALREQLALSRETERLHSALGPIALGLEQVQSAFDDIETQITRGGSELDEGRHEQAVVLFESARVALSELEARVVASLLSRARADRDAGKSTAAALALNELIALDALHADGQRLLREILAHRIVNSIGMELVFIPPGDFLMGSGSDEPDRDDDERQRRVEISQGFYMGATEVAQSQWNALMEGNPSRWQGNELPVEQVSWADAMEFCLRLSHAEGRRYRLPSEVEWEYACRAGTEGPFSFGETISSSQANYDGRYVYANGPKGVFRGQTVPVASFPANAWGLRDTHGNVWEWCVDAAEDGQEDGVAPISLGERERLMQTPAGTAPVDVRVLRGGSWRNRPRYCRCANRVTGATDTELGNVGFRVVLESD